MAPDARGRPQADAAGHPGAVMGFRAQCRPGGALRPVRRSAAAGGSPAQPASPAGACRAPAAPQCRSQAGGHAGRPRRYHGDLGSQPVTIGRSNDSTLVLTDDYASTRHARLVPTEGAWLVEDMGSTNGTYLDRTKVARPTPVPLLSLIHISEPTRLLSISYAV